MGFTSIQNLVVDNSSAANFKSWASAISAFFTTCGWTQTADTGQVKWSAANTVVAITAASVSGSNTAYTYTLTSGTPLLVGQVPVITGMVAGGNNGTFTITSLSGTLTAGTFTVVNASGVNATGQSGTGTAPFVVPGSSTTVFEMWQPAADPLQTGVTAYYLKIQYGNASGVNNPQITISIGTGTSGAGVLTGLIAGTYTIPSSAPAGQGVVTFECDFCGDVDRMGIMMWRTNSTTQQAGAFFVERTKTTSGANSSDGVTLFALQGVGFANRQRTIAFGVGLGPALTVVAGIDPDATGSLVFNNSAPLSPTFAFYGKWGNSQTVLGLASQGDIIEGMILTTTLYSSSRTYLASKNGAMGSCGGTNNMATLMRWD